MPRLVLPRPAPADHAPVFGAEIALVPDGADLPALLREQVEETAALAARFGEMGAGLRYAPGKWSVRETIGHLADCERILSYRMLRFLRGDETPLAGFDHDAYVPAAAFERRALREVVDELRSVRGATVALLAGAPAEALGRRGHVGSGAITVGALAYLIAGHERHHQLLLRERYLPLLETASASAPAPDARPARPAR